MSGHRASTARGGEPKLPLHVRAMGLVVSLNILAGALVLRHNHLQRAAAEPVVAERLAAPARPAAPAAASPGPASSPQPSPSPVATSAPAPASAPAPEPPPAPASAPAPEPPPAPASAPAPEPPPLDTLGAYRGLGAWVDHFDYGRPGSLAPAAIVDELAARGVRTLYLQTGRWSSARDIDNPEAMGAFVDLAHQRGLEVIGWYLPGFADLDRDIRRSLAVLELRTPSGGGFDGFAPDIEDAVAVGGDRRRFNDGIAEYSRRLRAAVAGGTVLGAIVPDARNNERAPGSWAGFPWQEIGRQYDVVLPMAYWSVTKNPAACRTIQMDAAAYIRDVVAKTNALMGTMGTPKPMHPIGGIADCNTVEEIAAYAASLAGTGAIGGSLYDFQTNHDHPLADALWGALASVNALIPAPLASSPAPTPSAS